jgi:hypothetical protein
MSAADLLAQVKAYAVQNYERDGWDFLVECHDDAEITAAIKGATSLHGALLLAQAEFALKLNDEVRRSVINAGEF